jgi:hypothetical protein
MQMYSALPAVLPDRCTYRVGPLALRRYSSVPGACRRTGSFHTTDSRLAPFNSSRSRCRASIAVHAGSGQRAASRQPPAPARASVWRVCAKNAVPSQYAASRVSRTASRCEGFIFMPLLWASPVSITTGPAQRPNVDTPT